MAEVLKVLVLTCARLTACNSTGRNERISDLCFVRRKYGSVTSSCPGKVRLPQRLMRNPHFTSTMKMRVLLGAAGKSAHTASSPFSLKSSLEQVPPHCCLLTKGTTCLFFSSFYIFCYLSEVSKVEWLRMEINCAIARREKRKWFRKIFRKKCRKM